MTSEEFNTAFKAAIDRAFPDRNVAHFTQPTGHMAVIDNMPVSYNAASIDFSQRADEECTYLIKVYVEAIRGMFDDVGEK